MSENPKIDRLQEFMQTIVGSKYGWQKKSAEVLGISPQHWHNLKSNSTPIGASIRERMRELGCDMTWFDTGTHEGGDIERVTIRLMNIPVYDYVRAGTKHNIITENPVEYIAIPKTNDTTLFAVRVKGESMAPLLHSGDTIIVSKQAEVKSADLAIVNYEDGEFCLRYVHFSDHMVTLTSENSKEYPPVVVKQKEIHAAYRVVKMIKDI